MLVWTKRGLECPAGGFVIDPSRSVDQAIITHGHSDHARKGSKNYTATEASIPILKERLGEGISAQGYGYGQKFAMGETTVSFHSAGHILGSAQVRIEHGGQVWVVSGDYKRDEDPSCDPFEVVECDTFVSETTFGLPIYHWTPREQVSAEMARWFETNLAQKRTSIVCGYSLGKAQRLLFELRERLPDVPIWVHSDIARMNARYTEAGWKMPTYQTWDPSLTAIEARQGIIITAPQNARTRAIEQFENPARAFASGWMLLERQRMRADWQKGFLISDHADWGGLCRTVQESKAKRVILMHGQTQAFSRYLCEKGIDAQTIDVLGDGSRSGSEH